MNEIGGHVGLQNELHIQTTQSLPNHSSHEIKTMSSLKPWFFLVTSEAGLRPVVRFLMDLQSFFRHYKFLQPNTFAHAHPFLSVAQSVERLLFWRPEFDLRWGRNFPTSCRGEFRGLGGGFGKPPGCPKKNNFFFALKIRKRNKACTIHCTGDPR